MWLPGANLGGCTFPFMHEEFDCKEIRWAKQWLFSIDGEKKGGILPIYISKETQRLVLASLYCLDVTEYESGKVEELQQAHARIG